MYDKNWLKSSAFNFPVIGVGNLAIGGTGKTPMVEYLIRLLKDEYKTATLSRGYKRKTKGFAIANEFTTALEIGDEPMQFHRKFSDITVAVGEERLEAIPQLLQDRPDTAVIILDDAFQHRAVRAGLNILLTEYKNLYTRDLMMPSGDLRDNRISAKRSDIIIISKCDHGLSETEKMSVVAEINPTASQSVYFTTLIYGSPYHIFNKKEISIGEDLNILLLCAIANPRPLKELLNVCVNSYDMLRYPDHHIFSIDDLEEIKKQFGRIATDKKIILTTEKDAVRLQKFEAGLKDYPIYAIPIRHGFLFNEANAFNDRIISFIKGFYKK